MKIGVIIQARMGSKRFPAKVMADLCGWPVLWHVIERCKQIKANQVIVDVPKQDAILTRLAADCGVTSTTYQENGDLLEAYLKAANQYAIDTIVRITGDCPLLQPHLCNKTIELYEAGHCSYAAIGHPEGGFPQGYGCEVFSRLTLQLANELATDPYDREHVTPWMQRNLRCRYLKNDRDESHLNYCVDYPEDIARLEKIIGENQNHA